MKSISSKLSRFAFVALLLTSLVGANAFSQTVGQMDVAWTSTISTRQLPTGATVPAVAAITGSSKVRFELNVDAESVDNVTETTAWTALGNAVRDSLELNYIVDVWQIDTSFASQGRIVLQKVLRRFDNFAPNDYPMQYTAATDVFFVTGTFEWKPD